MTTMISSEGKFLGKQVEYPQKYAPEMLVAVPRHFNRTQYDLHESNLPFMFMGFITISPKLLVKIKLK